mgnify:CR=1 FL=1
MGLKISAAVAKATAAKRLLCRRIFLILFAHILDFVDNLLLTAFYGLSCFCGVGNDYRAADHTENNAHQEFIVHNVPPLREYYARKTANYAKPCGQKSVFNRSPPVVYPLFIRSDNYSAFFGRYNDDITISLSFLCGGIYGFTPFALRGSRLSLFLSPLPQARNSEFFEGEVRPTFL